MFKKLIITGLLLASTLNVQAAVSASFGVSGTITPGACSLTLTGGVINLGAISTTAVKAYPTNGRSAYAVPEMLVPFAITCPSLTNVQMSFIDNKSGKKIVLNDGYDEARYGMVDGTGVNAIGAYQVSFTNLVLDGVGAKVYSAPNNTTKWSAATGIRTNFSAPGYTNGFGKTLVATAPNSFKSLAGNLRFEVFLSNSYIDAATANITPNGSGTVALVYL